MSLDIEDLKRKILYRCSYRGTKEMDILVASFVKSIINEIDINQLKELNILVNLNDEDLISIRKKESKLNLKDSALVKKFQNFQL